MNNQERQQTEPKQVIVVNRNLNMPHGKLAAQVSHASLGALFECGKKSPNELHIDLEQGSAVEQWVNKRFTKVVLAAKNEAELLKIHKKVEEAGLPNALITDAGFTVFDKPTITCLGIGPVFPNEIDHITKRLRVY